MIPWKISKNFQNNVKEKKKIPDLSLDLNPRTNWKGSSQVTHDELTKFCVNLSNSFCEILILKGIRHVNL